MAETAGEELVGSYLQYRLGCPFIQYNQKIPHGGEIDVIGINFEDRTVYLCEIATHTRGGFQYTKGGKPYNKEKLVAKFERCIAYANEHFKDLTTVFMFWSPKVRDSKKGSKYNQSRDIEEFKQMIKKSLDKEIIIKINRDYMECINELRLMARNTHSAFQTPVMRFLQIEEKLKAHLDHLERTERKNNKKVGPKITLS